jgi:hypothetical protein
LEERKPHSCKRFLGTKGNEARRLAMESRLLIGQEVPEGHGELFREKAVLLRTYPHMPEFALAQDPPKHPSPFSKSRADIISNTADFIIIHSLAASLYQPVTAIF